MTDKTEVAFEEAHIFAKSIKADIIKETSAKDNNGINELFQEIAVKLYRKQKANDVRILEFKVFR